MGWNHQPVLVGNFFEVKRLWLKLIDPQTFKTKMMHRIRNELKGGFKQLFFYVILMFQSLGKMIQFLWIIYFVQLGGAETTLLKTDQFLKFQKARMLNTLPKFNSSPLKSSRAPIGKDRLPTTIFSEAMLNFGGVVFLFKLSGDATSGCHVSEHKGRSSICWVLVGGQIHGEWANQWAKTWCQFCCTGLQCQCVVPPTE